MNQRNQATVPRRLNSWRRGGDLNPRYPKVYTISSRAQSTELCHLSAMGFTIRHFSRPGKDRIASATPIDLPYQTRRADFYSSSPQEELMFHHYSRFNILVILASVALF